MYFRRLIDNELEDWRLAGQRKPLMQHPQGFFAMTPQAIQGNIDALNEVGVKASKEHFDTSLLAEI